MTSLSLSWYFGRTLFPAAAAVHIQKKQVLTQRFTLEDAQKVTIPTLLVKGELSPKFLHQIIDILASCMPNSQELIIPAESHNLGLLEKPQVFNASVLEFLFKHS